MTRNKDFKRLVRDRMRKTGEAYTAARAQLLRKQPAATRARTAARVAKGSTPRIAAPSTTPASVPSTQVSALKPTEFAAVAGMSDAALKAKTGCDWQKWVKALDHHGAAELSHAEIAALIRQKYKTKPWWTQMVAVGYERIRGLRGRGQQRDGTFQATKSRTFGVPVERLFNTWADSGLRARWLNGDGTAKVRVRTAAKPKSMRLDWTDGTIVSVTFAAKGAGKSSVAIEQVRLPNRDAVARVKEEWAGRFDTLANVLGKA